MEELEKFQKVNKCSTSEELAEVVMSLCDEHGMISSTSGMFNGKEMSNDVEYVVNGGEADVLTRMYGIRQQALYLRYNKEW